MYLKVKGFKTSNWVEYVLEYGRVVLSGSDQWRWQAGRIQTNVKNTALVYSKIFSEIWCEDL